MTEENVNQVNEQHEAPATPKAMPVVLALLAVFVIYLLMAAAGLPQKWSNAVLNADHHDAAATQTDHAAAPADQAAGATDAKAPAKTEAAHESEHAVGAPPIWTVVPFCLLLLCIAILPLIKATEHWWESNFHRFLVAAGLGLIILLYYMFMCDFPIAVHWPVHSIVQPDQGSVAMGWAIIVNAIINDYIPFIVLLFALFTISGGIRISGDLKASPFVNTVIIAIGAALASFVGTTAAAMLLIRLLLETNKERKYKAHTVIFFIFCACNCGGCLLPIGDPPLFLGYLKGVNFLWTFHLWKEWMFVNGIVLMIYFLWDSLWFYRRETDLNKALDKTHQAPLRISGWFPNLFCLMGVVAAVMFLAPGKTIGSFNPWMFLREIAQLLMVVISLACGARKPRVDNSFNYAAIIEVAALFFGIFLCMQAPLQILNVSGGKISEQVNHYGSKMGLSQSQQFFWMTGTLSSVLDNAPTYLVFFETARAASADHVKKLQSEGKVEEAKKMEASLESAEKASGVRIPISLLVAVSVGAVFMGSMTYIGNGPNFMVKSIAEQSGVKMPSFFGYMVYSIVLLLPVFIIMTLIFMK